MPEPRVRSIQFVGPAAFLTTLSAAMIALAQPDLEVANGGATVSPAASDVDLYRRHISFLADPFMEGRAPGTRGNAIAADYIEFCFQRAGLQPLFDSVTKASDGSEVITPRASFRQQFEAGSEAKAKASELAILPGDAKFQQDEDYTVLGFSGSATVEGDLVFVGYSIEASPRENRDYSSYAEGDDLTGKIALILRFEPMDEHGKSKWAGPEAAGGWSNASGLASKFTAAIKRHAAGIIIVNTPGAADARASKLDSTEASARWTRAMDIPVFLMSPDAADRLVRRTDDHGRSLMDLRRIADEKGGLIPLPAARVRLHAELARTPRTTWNIAGLLPGRGKGGLADQFVIIGGHYDHVGYGYFGSRSNDVGIIHPGADDNASGASGVLLAAELMARTYATLPDNAEARSIIFMAFSAEESGLNGSRYFVRNSPIGASQVDAMLNMDMIGRVRDHAVELQGASTAEGFEALLKPILDESGFEIKYLPGGSGPSDHTSFYSAQIPVLHFFSKTHPEYHTPRDVVELINFQDAVGIVHTVCRIAETLAMRPQPLTFKTAERPAAKQGDKPADQTPSRPTPTMAGVKVRFGIAPGNYGEVGNGVLVEGVTEGTSAAVAGIQKDDRLTSWNGKPIDSVENWMEYLAEHKPGDLVDVGIRRNGKDEVVRVTLKAREQEAR